MLNTSKHRTYMYQIIKELFGTDWSEKIAFKGGTMAYFIHGLDRFSTDIDLDFLEGLPSEKQTQDIQRILSKHGTIKDFQKFRNMHRYIFSYGDGEYNIKIECNTRVWEANIYEVISFFGSPIRAMEKSTMFANKLVAVIDRENPTSRDLWDIHFFFTHHFPINQGVIQERTSMPLYDFFRKLKTYIVDSFPANKIVDVNLGVVLDEKQKSRAKSNLVQDISGYIDLQLFELDKE